MKINQKQYAILLSVFSFCLLVIFSNNSLAVPSLGVATNDIYYVAEGDTFQAYQDYFASGSEPASKNYGDEGFRILPNGSGTELHIFTSILNADIYLLTEYDLWNAGNPITFEGQVLLEIPDTGQADGYTSKPYYGVNLGPVCIELDGTTGCDGWSLLPGPPFEPAPYYVLTDIIEFSAPLPLGSYIFSAADLAGDGLKFNGNGHDPFSPKTSSTVVPEPETIYLLGMTLVGLFFTKRKMNE